MPRGDGKLRIRFIDVGQGDCTVIACPDGKIVLFDCGSSNFSDVNRTLIRNAIVDNNLFLYDNGTYGADSLKVDALVMSHPDKDHYNQVPYIFWDDFLELRTTRFEKIYHSMNLSQYYLSGFSSWAAGYFETQTQNKMMKLPGGKSKRIKAKINVFIGANKPLGALEQLIEDDVNDNRALEILDGTNLNQGSKKSCKVYVLAAGYVDPIHINSSDEKKRNEASVVLKIKFGNDSIIITGDATTDTEAFMLEKYDGTDWLEADLLRVGHHGSDTSSSEDFVKEVFSVKPGAVVISVKVESKPFCIPKKEVIDRCEKHAETGSPNHLVGYFDSGLAWQTKNTTSNIYLTGISGSLTHTFSGS